MKRINELTTTGKPQVQRGVKMGNYQLKTMLEKINLYIKMGKVLDEKNLYGILSLLDFNEKQSIKEKARDMLSVKRDRVKEEISTKIKEFEWSE